MSDPQKNRLYAAEDVPTSPTMATVAEVQRYVDKVLGRAYLRKKYGSRLPRKVTVLDGRMRRSACATYTWQGAVIRAPRWSRSEQTVLHELAHHITWRDQDHGPEFAAVYLDLVRHMLGADAAARLQARFRVHGVRVLDSAGKPRLPQVPPALREYAAERKAGLEDDKAWRSLMRGWSERFRVAANNGHDIDCHVCGSWAPTERRTRSQWQGPDEVEWSCRCENGHELSQWGRVAS